MSWAEQILTTWTCDGDECTAEVTGDDVQPEGWVHTMTGFDLCPSCRRTACPECGGSHGRWECGT